jgi:hypothetical protein
MRRTLVLLTVLVGCLTFGVVVWRRASGETPRTAVPERPPSRSLGLSQVILFNTGLGFFQREGEVDGDARVDLNFPNGDVNDLIKSMVLHDGKQPGSISYDGQESLDRSLRSFALDLTYNPTFGQLLNQARGEKVEVSTQDRGGPAAVLTGVIVGMETMGERKDEETHSLNLSTADGVRRVPLTQINRVRFLNPLLEEEFHRALSVLAGSHNTGRRSVSVHLRGEGKRPVKLGYVVEAPIWKSSYRLMLDHNAKEPTLQSWAVVENTTDEDWKDVRVALIAARPISFQMDLSQPLFLPRPTVEPRAFASLRPAIHVAEVPNVVPQIPNAGNSGLQLGGIQLGGLGGAQIGGFGGGFGNLQGFGVGGFNGGRMGMPGLDANGLPAVVPSQFNRYQNGPGAPLGPSMTPASTRLTYEDLQNRREQMLKEREQERERARRVGATVAALGEGIDAVVTNAQNFGDSFKYTLDQKVSLPRQMSSLLPVINGGVHADDVSIFNKSVHPRFPLRGLHLKNTTGQNLVQGPVSVFEDGVYVGDSQVPDMQPGQDRLISYAMDLGVEVREDAQTTEQLTSLHLGGDNWTRGIRREMTTTYHIRNRSDRERTLLVEHPVTADWKLFGTEKPIEKTPNMYRFEWKVPAGTSVDRLVVETRDVTDTARLADRATGRTRLLSLANDTGLEVKDEIRTHDELTSLRFAGDGVTRSTRREATTTYHLLNRSDRDRMLVVDHPVSPNWALSGGEKPNATTTTAYHFEWKVPPGKSVDKQVMEMQDIEDTLSLSDIQAKRGAVARDLWVWSHPPARTASELKSVKLKAGSLKTVTRQEITIAYELRNDTAEERTFHIEQGVTEGRTLVGGEKPTETTERFYRFDWKVPAGKTVRKNVVEEREVPESTGANTSGNEEVKALIESPAASPGVKAALTKLLTLRTGLAATKTALTDMQERRKEIIDDQERLRANIARVPPDSAAHKRYLEKFDAQETQLEKLHDQIGARQAEEKKQTEELDRYVQTLTAE